jgi:hypothetical protein
VLVKGSNGVGLSVVGDRLRERRPMASSSATPRPGR